MRKVDVEIIRPQQREARALSSLDNKKPVILTPLGTELTPEETGLFSKHKPYGFILFGEHCKTRVQVQKLCSDLRSCVGEDVVISIDQEGGRVARMRAPTWRNHPSAADMNDVYGTYKDLGEMLCADGVNVNFAPCLDVVPTGGRCDAIGDRCFSSDAKTCGEKGVDACKGLIDSGVVPVIKHMPGHGRAEEDSHYFLPVVKASEKTLLNDLKSFQVVCDSLNADQFHGMTAHVLYEVWDKENPATLSKTIIKNIIRDTIGFKGLLFSDDLAMKALDRYGDVVKRVHLSLEAGCDIALPCHTPLGETRAILESL
ncbi:MAG: beta-N-acetylhexosaminidase [Alphaproteobacteria bacterium]|nr:MAG: beta-N-acetylhexosaminidase [Alphaproteobacteria bacterium]